MILESVIFFALLLVATMAVSLLPRLMKARAWWRSSQRALHFSRSSATNRA